MVIGNLFWAVGSCGEVVLTTILICKGRWRSFPAFSALVALPLLTSLVLLPMARLHALNPYGDVYAAFSVCNFLLQLAVVFEIARVVLRPTGTWVRDARKQFILSGAAGTTVALALACMVSPPAPSQVEVLELRGDLFTSLLVFELFVAVSLASNRLGLGWRNHIMAISQGFTIWSVVATLVDSLHSYFGTSRLYEGADYLKFTVYLGVLTYWSVQLWREEPVRQPISKKLRRFILALHERVQYDLGEAER
jgi:hypothetical protein